MDCSESFPGLGSVKDGDGTFPELVKTSDNHQAEDIFSTERSRQRIYNHQTAIR